MSKKLLDAFRRPVSVLSLCMLLVNNFKLNITVAFLKYERLSTVYLPAFNFLPFFVKVERRYCDLYFSSSEDHHSSLVLGAVWQSPGFGHLASMRKPYCGPCESTLAGKLHGAQKETE